MKVEILKEDYNCTFETPPVIDRKKGFKTPIAKELSTEYEFVQ